MLDQEDLQLIERFKAENLQKKNRIVEEYRYYDIPDGYKNERAKEAPTYELYLMNKIELSPEDEEAINELGEKAGNFERVRTLTSQVMTSEEWYSSVYGIGFFEKFNINELSWYLYDAAILMSKWESALNWENSLLISWSERNKKGNWIWWLLGILLFFCLGEFFFGSSKDGYLQRSLFFLTLSVAAGYIGYIKHQKKKKDLHAIDERIAEVKECIEWHRQKLWEHPLVEQQGKNSSSFFFDRMRQYVDEGRVKTLQEALNLYHQEQQYNQLLGEQEQIRRQTEQIHTMTTINTVYNIFKK